MVYFQSKVKLLLNSEFHTYTLKKKIIYLYNNNSYSNIVNIVNWILSVKIKKKKMKFI